MSTKELESMTLQELKDLYKTLNNPVPVVGTGKNGCKVKQNWIEAVQKTVESESQPDQTEEEPAPKKESQFITLITDDMSEIRIHRDCYPRESGEVVGISGLKTDGIYKLHTPSSETYTVEAKWTYGAHGYHSSYLWLWFVEGKCNIHFATRQRNTGDISFERPGYEDFIFTVVDESSTDQPKPLYPVKNDPQPIVESEPQPEVTEWEEIPEDEQIPFYDPDYRPDPDEELADESGYRALSQREKIKLPVSFGWTADRLLAGMKTVTRRTWQDKYAQIFVKAYQQGKLVPAFDKDRRYGGKAIGYLKLTCEPYKESILDMPNADVKAEGFPELTWGQFVNKFFPDKSRAVRDGHGNENDEIVWVIRFEFYPLETEIDEIPLIDETPKDSNHCQLNIEQELLLEKYKFERIGHAFDDSPFVGSDPYCSLAGWDVYLSQNIPYPAKLATQPKLTMLSLVNYQKNEWWGLKLNCYSTTKNRTKLKQLARKIILELGFCLEQKTGVKA